MPARKCPRWTSRRWAWDLPRAPGTRGSPSPGADCGGVGSRSGQSGASIDLKWVLPVDKLGGHQRLQLWRTPHFQGSGEENPYKLRQLLNRMIARPGFEPGSPAPKASMLDHYNRRKNPPPGCFPGEKATPPDLKNLRSFLPFFPDNPTPPMNFARSDGPKDTPRTWFHHSFG
jgi:hypothetical protein